MRAHALLRGDVEDRVCGHAPQWVVVWRKGDWQCELHALADAWRFHLYYGTELEAVWPLNGEAAFDRAQRLRDLVQNPLTAPARGSLRRMP